MKLYRYMSKEEFSALMNGEKMVNESTHSGARTNSKGFCFLGDPVIICDDNGTEQCRLVPLDCLQFMSGIVSPDLLVEFEVKEGSVQLFEGYGAYDNSFKDFATDVCIVEYSTYEYDRNSLVPKRVIVLPQVSQKRQHVCGYDDMYIDNGLLDSIQGEFSVDERAPREYIWHDVDSLASVFEEFYKKRRQISRTIDEINALSSGGQFLAETSPSNASLKEFTPDKWGHYPQEVVESNPELFIIPECIPACRELWAKNIYTYKVSNHDNEGVCWISIDRHGLSLENKKILAQLYGKNFVNDEGLGENSLGVRVVGAEGQRCLLKLAKLFQIQDVPRGEAYISVEEFLVKYCDECYDKVPNPKYAKKSQAAENNDIIDLDDLIDDILDQEEPYVRVLNMEKVERIGIAKLAEERGMVFEEDRVYLSAFHYKKHEAYVNEITKKPSVNSDLGTSLKRLKETSKLDFEI